MTFTFQSAQLIFDQESLDLIPDKTSSSEALYVDFTSSDTAGQKRFQIFIHPKKEVVLKEFELRLSVPLSQNSAILSNGFLSNHRSGTYRLSDKLPGRGWLAPKPAFHQQTPSFSTAGPFRSWHYGYVGPEEKGLFLGSLNETTAFTEIEYDPGKQEIIIRKDIKDLHLGHSFPLLDLLVITGKKETSFATYFSTIEGPRFPAPPLTGWIASKRVNANSAKAITSFLANRKEENIPTDLILIGAGYTKEAGDWLFSNDQFPNGLPPLISEIKSANLKVGMTISPLLCTAESDVYKQHSDWILKDDQNKPISIKTANGIRYVLDAYDVELQNHLQVFCYTVTTQWGIDLLKFDHLSTAFAKQRKTKTRAQACNDFLKMLRNSCPDTLIWASDLPMATGWLYANYTSTTTDILEDWETRLSFLYGHPNAMTAKVQLKNMIHRYNYQQYGTAANLVTLTDKNLTEAQQHTILFINTLFSNISVIADAPESLSTEITSEWRLAEQWKSAKVTGANFPEENTCIVDFKNDGKDFQGLVNLSGKERKIGGILVAAGETLVLGKRG